MHKSMTQFSYATMALLFGLAAAAPPAFAGGACYPALRHHHHHMAARWAHPGWRHALWANNGWGPGVGFYALTGVAVDHPAAFNHPYYYGGGPYGSCGGARLVYDARGDILGRQAVYIC